MRYHLFPCEAGGARLAVACVLSGKGRPAFPGLGRREGLTTVAGSSQRPTMKEQANVCRTTNRSVDETESH